MNEGYQVGSGERRARKPHLCDLCDELIHVGEEHRWWTVVGTDGWYTGRAHTKCSKAWWWSGAQSGDELSDPMEFRREVLVPYVAAMAKEQP